MWGSVLWGTPHPRMLISPLAMKHTGAVGAKMGIPTWSWRKGWVISCCISISSYIVMMLYHLISPLDCPSFIFILHWRRGWTNRQTRWAPWQPCAMAVDMFLSAENTQKGPCFSHEERISHCHAFVLRAIFNGHLGGEHTAEYVKGSFGFRDLSPSRLVQNLRPATKWWLFFCESGPERSIDE